MRPACRARQEAWRSFSSAIAETRSFAGSLPDPALPVAPPEPPSSAPQPNPREPPPPASPPAPALPVARPEAASSARQRIPWQAPARASRHVQAQRPDDPSNDRCSACPAQPRRCARSRPHAQPASTHFGAPEPSRWPTPPRSHARRRRGTAAAPDRRGRAPFLRVDAQAPHPHSVLQRRSCPCHGTSPHSSDQSSTTFQPRWDQSPHATHRGARRATPCRSHATHRSSSSVHGFPAVAYSSLKKSVEATPQDQHTQHEDDAEPEYPVNGQARKNLLQRDKDQRTNHWSEQAGDPAQDDHEQELRRHEDGHARG